jgi:hypothetical protein
MSKGASLSVAEARGFLAGRGQRLGLALILAGAMAGLVACGSDKSPTSSRSVAESSTGDLTVPIAEAIDALFLGTGPLIPRDGSSDCPVQGIWSGYSRGTALRLRVSTRVSQTVIEGLGRAIAPIPEATAGSLTVTLETTDEADPQPGLNEVTVTELPLPRSAGCSSNSGCVDYRFAGRGLLMAARVVEPPGRSLAAYAYDAVGHGILGLCRIDARRIGGPEESLMAGGGSPVLTGLDLEALRAVFGSSLAPGANRSAFLAARLVSLQAGELPRPR